MADPYFFGYGSLVNTATHSYPAPTPVRVTGWRRMWRHTALRDVAYLTATPDKASQIDGLIAQVPGHDWAALDAREYAYTRSALDLADVQGEGIAASEVQIYQTRTDQDAPPSVRHPILLSYLDVVVQGYLRVFGEDGVARFFETTDGWDAPIRNDRAAPRYPRHQLLTPQEQALVDAHLRAVSAHVA
jgi:hypothetical protein